MNNADYSLDITAKHQGISLTSIPESNLGTRWAQITYHLGTEQEETRTYNLSNLNQAMIYGIEKVENFCTTRQQNKVHERMQKRLGEFRQERRERNRIQELNLEARMGRRYTI